MGGGDSSAPPPSARTASGYPSASSVPDADATRRRSRPAIAAFVTGGSARRGELAQRERRVPEAELRRLLQRRRKLSNVRPRAAPALRRAARARSGSAARGSRDRRSPVGSPRRGGRRRAPAPRARAPSRSPPPPTRYPSIASQLFAYAAEWDARSITRIRTPGCDGDAADERGAGVERRSHLEVRRPRPAQRPRAEECPAEVRRPAARARDDAAGRPVERQALRVRGRPPPSGRRSRAAFRRRGAAFARSRSNACWWYVRISDSTRSARRIANARRATADSARSRWNESLPRPRRCTVPAVWKSAESSASRSHRRSGATRGELGPRVGRERARAHSSVPSSASRRRLSRAPDGPYPPEHVRLPLPGGDDPVTRHDEREDVPGAEAAGGPRGAGPPGERGEPAVRHDLAPRERARRREQLALERAQPVLVDLDVVVRDRCALRGAAEPPAQIRHEPVTSPVTGCRLA